MHFAELITLLDALLISLNWHDNMQRYTKGAVLVLIDMTTCKDTLEVQY